MSLAITPTTNPNPYPNRSRKYPVKHRGPVAIELPGLLLYSGGMDYTHLAKVAVSETSDLNVADLYVVWFVKVLQNWKALVSTDAVNGSYWEVTYNGDKQEAYVDHYNKFSNQVFKF